ncbi:MAG: hypothetical protein OHK93_000763 [Ramalina farinacea]|uniref:Uncharacterized protein n=1 Tax=Ramalina farinacea TaxID=258253 RepID=A0AA43QR23_9LECA|nr:hypothetical protein [Ramalina farinacea]
MDPVKAEDDFVIEDFEFLSFEEAAFSFEADKMPPPLAPPSIVREADSKRDGDVKEMKEVKEISESSQKVPAKVIVRSSKVESEDNHKPPPQLPKRMVERKSSSSSLPADKDLDLLLDEHQDLKSAHYDMRKELKAEKRENREQSLELRDLKRQNATMKEAYAAIQRELQQMSESGGKGGKLTKTEKAKYFEHFEMLEEKAAYFENEFRKRDTHLSYLTKQTRDANSDKENLEDETRRLNRKIRELSTSLTEARDDLLRLQPTAQISDSEIAEQYSNLCQQIAGWVDDATEDTEALETYFERINNLNELHTSIRDDVTNRMLGFAKKQQECLPLLLQHLIHCKVHEEILGTRIYVYGLDDAHASLLRGIEEGMADLTPKRDTLTIHRWRSETLSALLQMPDFTAEQDRLSLAFSQSLIAVLATLLHPNSPLDDLHTRITLPAIRLSNTLRTAATATISTYDFFNHQFARSNAQPFAVFRNEIAHYQMVDVATQKFVKGDSNVRVRESDGRIGEEMFVVSPGMVRSVEAGGEEERRERGRRKERTVLVKPVVLVKLDEPMGKRGKGPGVGLNRALGAWTGGWFGGSGGGGSANSRAHGDGGGGVGSDGDMGGDGAADHAKDEAGPKLVTWQDEVAH